MVDLEQSKSLKCKDCNHKYKSPLAVETVWDLAIQKCPNCKSTNIMWENPMEDTCIHSKVCKNKCVIFCPKHCPDYLNKNRIGKGTYIV